MANRNLISWAEARAGDAWLADWLACGRTLEAVRTERGHAAGNRGAPDVMRQSARERSRAVLVLLGGEECATYRIASAIVLEDRPPREVAAELVVRVPAVMDMLRWSLRLVAARVYRLPDAA